MRQKVLNHSAYTSICRPSGRATTGLRLTPPDPCVSNVGLSALLVLRVRCRRRIEGPLGFLHAEGLFSILGSLTKQHNDTSTGGHP